MPKGKKKGQKPAHQNSFAFRHNPKSKLTDKILSSPNEGLCQRCHDKIEWRKTYRKYKPLTQPSKCNLCQKRNVTAAYHTICSGCARSQKAIDKMSKLRLDAPEDKTEMDKTEILDLDSGVEIRLSQDENEENRIPPGKKVCRVCAMCCKAAALRNDDEDDQKAQVDEMKREMEEKLGRQLKLREAKAIERKVERALEKEKQEAKERRRMLREESMRNRKMSADGEELDQDDHCGLEDLYTYSKDEDVDEKVDFHSSFRGNADFGDEDDEFLKAVGGQEKLLTGEAYQKMLLARGEETQ